MRDLRTALMTATEVAALLGVTAARVRQADIANVLKPARIGRGWIYRRAAVLGYLGARDAARAARADRQARG